MYLFSELDRTFTAKPLTAGKSGGILVVERSPQPDRDKEVTTRS